LVFPIVPTVLPQLELPSGATMPALGLGTWRMGERASERGREVAALQLGLSLGLNLIDTAEMYGDGGAEAIVADAIDGRREQVFLVSKVYPHNAGRRDAVAACARSLKRLRTDHLDLYLLHWRGDVPLAQTVQAFESLRSEGRIRQWGVSNFDAADMRELLSIEGGQRCAANQVLYHLGSRGIEWDLLPLCRAKGIAVMAYSPVDQGRLLRHRGLAALATRLGVTPAEIALAWLLAQAGVAVIPKATNPTHVRYIRAAADLRLAPTVMAELAALFPPPKAPAPLAML
jgi:diketogulonate reductase-like aldo/keto reductase